MNVRFCEFCSTVHPDEATHCPECGTRLIQSATEEYFNDPANPWPFVPVDRFCLRIQGQPRTIRFSGTHSVYHLWSTLHTAFDRMRLCCRFRQDEMELVDFEPEQRPADFRVLEPGLLLNCRHRRFSVYTYGEADPEMAEVPGEMEMIYQGSFEIEDCPPGAWGNVLGWLVGTAPRPETDTNWTYDI